MAIIAGIGALNMRRLFADGDHAVVTRNAAADDLGVIDSHYGRENIRRVAVLAYIG